MFDKARTTIAGLAENDKPAEISAESMAVNGGMEEVPDTMRNCLSARTTIICGRWYSPENQEQYINDCVRKALSKPPVYIACREDFSIAHIQKELRDVAHRQKQTKNHCPAGPFLV